MNLKISDIQNLSYADFVSFINQWNVLPGALSTLSKWAKYSNLSTSSYILEIACTTGFSSRELAILTGCKGIGIDISKKAIEKAKYNKKVYAPKIGIKYIHADGYRFQSKKLFSHIIVGASLKFFSDPAGMLNRCIGMLQDGGYILASPFYIVKKIPLGLIKKAKRVFDITVTTESYKEIMSMYRGLEIIYEDRNDIFQETEDELHHYCRCTVDRACQMLNINNLILYNTMYERLYEIKKMSNELRLYQNYAVLVLRYRKLVYPKRFIELF